MGNTDILTFTYLIKETPSRPVNHYSKNVSLDH